MRTTPLQPSFAGLATVLAVAWVALAFALTAASSDAEEPPAGEPQPTFDADIQPILSRHCARCHDSQSKKSGLELTTLSGILQGGESGEPAVVPGKPAESRLVELVESGEMPPAGNPRPSPAELAAIRRWIESGAGGGEESPYDQDPKAERARQAHFLLEVKCYQCHGAKQQQAALDLRTVRSMLTGGKSGPALVPGDAAASRMIERIQADEMPPRDVRYKLSIKPVTELELELIKQWIDEGAAPPPPALEDDNSPRVSDQDRQWWAFKPPLRPAVPTIQGRGPARTPIDAFVLEKLATAGLALAPEAERATLIRRASFDLVGLPPTPAEIKAFVEDPSPAAYERLIDRLLEAPEYGERWGQHWLDAVGYTDSEGALGSDPVYPDFYRYRDYVIRSLNADKPYDRFLLEQLAGDELFDYSALATLTPEAADNLVATGLLRTGIDPTTSPETNFLYDRYQVLADTVEIVSSSLLGLTMRCARCHSHKYDPIPQRDYYRFTAIFSAAYVPHDWLKPAERFLPLATSEEQRAIDEHNAPVDAAVQALRTELDELTGTYSRRLFEQKLAALPEAIRNDTRVAIETPAAERTEVQSYLAEKFAEPLKVSPEELPAAFADYKQESESLEARLQTTEATRRQLPKAHGLTDLGPTPPPAWLLQRGEWNQRGPQVSPNVPEVLCQDGAAYRPDPPWPGAATTGRRLALARWLTRPDHPLTARVIVNRVWQHHFGTGIVATADDFGRAGAPPTHPELLDWLANEFVENGWSLKHLHRLIMTSAVYRQQSRLRPDAAAVDPENRLLWRMPLRRLEAEAIRDSILAVSGRLNRAQFGPPTAVEVLPDGQVATSDAPESNRRSIYMLHRRSTPLTILEAFDAPRLTTNCIQRRTSTVVSQALVMLNSAFVETQAARLADRVMAEAGTEADDQVAWAYQIVLGRPPSETECRWALDFLDQPAANAAPDRQCSSAPAASSEASEQAPPVDLRREAQVDFCLVLLNSAEFLYVD